MPANTDGERRGLSAASDDVLLLVIECLAISPGDLGLRDHYSNSRRQNLSTLNSLSRTCRRLYQLATPLLYRTYFKPANPYGPNISLQLFLRALLWRPALRSHVRIIAVTGWGKELTYGDGMYDGEFVEEGEAYPRYEFPRGAAPVSPTPEIAKIYRSALEDTLPGLHPKIRDRLYTCLCQGLVGAEATLLLTIAPNVTTLWLGVPSLQHNDDADLFTIPLQQAVQGTLMPQKFSKLSHVVIWSINGDADDRCLRLDEFASAILQFPNLQRIQFRGRYTEVTHLWDCPPRSSPVRSLTFLYSHLSANTIGRVVDSCAALRFLEIGYVQMYLPPVNWDQVAMSVSCAKASLEELLFRNHQPRREDLMRRVGIPTFGSFTEYTSLRRLTVPQHAIFKDRLSETLLNEGFLPPNIEYLSIFDCDTSIVTKLERLLHVTPLYFKSLQRLHTNDWLTKMYGPYAVPDPAGFLDTIYGLKRAFRAAKVRWETDGTHMDATDLDTRTVRAAFGRGWLKAGRYTLEVAAYCERTGRKVEWFDLKGKYQTWHPA